MTKADVENKKSAKTPLSLNIKLQEKELQEKELQKKASIKRKVLTIPKETSQGNSVQAPRHKKILNTLNWLYKTFPKVFKQLKESTGIKPLKIAIREDIFLSNEMQTSDITKIQCRRALRCYTRSALYLESLKTGVKRINLLGEPEGMVTEAEEAYAIQVLQSMSNKHKKAMKTQPIEPSIKE